MTRRRTGPTQAVRDQVYGRDGMACTVCQDMSFLQIHHRRPRAAGGTRRPESNLAGNLVLLCERCHAAVESHRDLARQRGYLVPQHVNPVDVPIIVHGVWSWLCDDGTAVPLADWQLADLDGGAAS